MNSEIVIAIISGVCVAVPSVIATIYSNRSSTKLMQHQISELEKKVEKHNTLVERMAVAENDIKTLYHKVDKKEEKKND